MKRHLARMKNTDQRLVVVYMQIPGKEDHALVISVDNLPPRLEQVLMEIVDSKEGQADVDLGNVMGRRMFAESNQTVLQAFHTVGLLHATSIDLILMFPEPNNPIPLRDLLIAMNRNIPESAEPDYSRLLQEETVPLMNQPKEQTDKFNPHLLNQNASANEANFGVAQNLLVEAGMLEEEARIKRERAYSYAPSLRPKARKPATPPVQVEAAPVPAAKAKTPTKAPAKAKTTTKRVYDRKKATS